MIIRFGSNPVWRARLTNTTISGIVYIMAKELSVEELREISPSEPWRYQLPIMHPSWRSFLLDDSYIARFRMLEANPQKTNNSAYFKFVSKITGIDEMLIDNVVENENVISVIPFVNTES